LYDANAKPLFQSHHLHLQVTWHGTLGQTSCQLSVAGGLTCSFLVWSYGSDLTSEKTMEVVLHRLSDHITPLHWEDMSHTLTTGDKLSSVTFLEVKWLSFELRIFHHEWE
jgi:hypothetical protein